MTPHPRADILNGPHAATMGGRLASFLHTNLAAGIFTMDELQAAAAHRAAHPEQCTPEAEAARRTARLLSYRAPSCTLTCAEFLAQLGSSTGARPGVDMPDPSAKPTGDD